MRPKHLLLVVPGTAFWTLVILGVATGDTAVWIAAAVVGVATAGSFAAIGVHKSLSGKAAGPSPGSSPTSSRARSSRSGSTAPTPRSWRSTRR